MAKKGIKAGHSRRGESPPEEHVQSAMEYLMTYSWSILVIAILLGAIFGLGMFSSSSYTGTACIASTGYLCQSPILNSTGNLSVTFGEEGYPITITGVGCTKNPGEPSFIGRSPSISLQPGQEKSIIFQCPISGSSVGTPFTGHLWIAYSQGAQSGLYVDVAKISAMVSTTHAFSSQSGGVPSGYAYVTNQGSNNVMIINTATNTIIGAISSGINDPTGVAISPDGTYAYVTNAGSNNVVIIDTATETVTGAITSGFSNPTGVTISPDGTYAYVINQGSSSATIIDTATNTVAGSITSGIYEPFSGAISPDGTYAYVVNPGNIIIINTATKVGTGSMAFFKAADAAFSPDGTYAYVAEWYAEDIPIIDTATETVTSTITGGFDGPIGVAFSPDGTYAYVTNMYSNNVVIINTATNTITGAITGGFSYPTGVAIAP